jgi:hypothetical protein
MTQIGFSDRRHDSVDVLPLLRIKIWQRNIQRGNTKTASADQRPSRRRQSLAPSNLATSD